MTFNHPTALDTALFPSTSPPLISTRNAPQSSDLLITQQYSLLLKLQRQYNLSTDLTNQQPINRREFAIALQSTIDRISDLQLAILSRDLAAIKYLKKAFALELAALPTQAKVAASPEKPKFTVGTKISGEVILTGIAIGGKPIEDEDNNDRRVTTGYRARLNINTSFTGFDRLRIRLQNSDIPGVNRVTGSDMNRLSYQGNTEGQLVRNPIYRQGGGSGVGITHKLGSSVTLGLGYLAEDANEIDKGLFGGSYGAIAQITYKPNPQFGIGVNYIRSFNQLDTNTGSERANDPFNDTSDAIAADAFGLQSSVKISPNVYLGGWAGFTRAQAIDLPRNPTANIFNWAATLSLVDVTGKDSLAGIIIGQPPKVTHNQFTTNGASFSDPDTSLHLEAFYRWPIAKNISTTAGMLVITSPNHNATNGTTYVGVIRTMLEF